METINERLRILIPDLGFDSWDKFDKELGNGRSTTVAICGERKQKPGALYMEKILLRFPNVNANWLLAGQGDMYLPKKSLMDYVQELESKFEIRDRDARRLETALDMASHGRIPNFRPLSKSTPVRRIRKIRVKYIAKTA